ncbi:right-handed parallel beta-helix repeat-containing protein [Sphingomonas sp. GlSt437]|uniref:right-handed parallel beta-helix repeat-containing protein n=1 Tax=Sphingomonas sp. GlSt437 TaxID=3389970 RepID=UPI003A8C8138
MDIGPKRNLFALLLLAMAAPAAAQATGAPFTVRETGQSFARLQDALMSIRGHDATILIAPGTYHQCGIQQAGHITFRAVQPGSVIFDGATCEDKAALVLRGAGSTVDGIVFRNMRVHDGNGAGIRIEIGDLTVTNSMFLDSQEGILGATDQPTTITIDHSTFSGLGQCDESVDCAHSIYLASTGIVRVTKSRFERGRGGHYVKLRVPQVVITDNSFDDSAGHKTNYAIDLPEGATGVIAANTFVQGPDKENWTAFIAVAAEQRKYRSAGLRVEGNAASLAPGQSKNPALVADVSRERLLIGANQLGPGVRAFEQR